MNKAPRTPSGRAAWDKAAGLGPKIDTLTVTAREWRETILAIEREAAAPPEPPLDVEALRMQALRMQVLRLGGVLEGFAHGVGTRSNKPPDPDYDVRWECLCGIGGAPKRVERHWLAELRKWASLHEGPQGADR